jgi:hypothetical protein
MYTVVPAGMRIANTVSIVEAPRNTPVCGSTHQQGIAKAIRAAISLGGGENVR